MLASGAGSIEAPLVVSIFCEVAERMGGRGVVLEARGAWRRDELGPGSEE